MMLGEEVSDAVGVPVHPNVCARDTHIVMSHICAMVRCPQNLVI